MTMFRETYVVVREKPHTKHLVRDLTRFSEMFHGAISTRCPINEETTRYLTCFRFDFEHQRFSPGAGDGSFCERGVALVVSVSSLEVVWSDPN